jgi:hypothetical protein
VDVDIPPVVLHTQAMLIIEDAKKNARMVHQDMADNLKLLERDCMTSLSKYEKENNTVYLERLPSADALVPIVGAQLVKSTVPEFLTSKTPSEVFTSVVPDTSARALSRYTDMVDTTARELLDRSVTCLLFCSMPVPCCIFVVSRVHLPAPMYAHVAISFLVYQTKTQIIAARIFSLGLV